MASRPDPVPEVASQREQILDEILATLDAGVEPDLAALESRFPESTAEVSRIYAAAKRYGREVPDLEVDHWVELGDRIGDYVVERLIGSGGMGQVFLARQRSLGMRPVALKILTRNPWTDRELKRFEREAILLAGLHHPRLAEVYGFGEDAGTHFIAMRFVEGPTLQEVLQDLAAGRLDLSAEERIESALRIVTDVAEALAVVHSAGLLHRDIKPSNIIIEGATAGTPPLDGEAVLVDFGLVRAAADTGDTRTNFSAATPSYASPEQLLEQRMAPCSDVFSLGVTFHDLLTRRLAGQRRLPSAGLDPLVEHCPHAGPDMVSVVAKMTELDPRWRYRDAVELLEDLRALRAGEPVSARFPPLKERVSRLVRRNPARLLRGGVMVVLLLGVVLVGSFLSQEVRAARTVHEAWQAGDLMAMKASGHALGYIGSLLLRGDDEREQVHRVIDPTSEWPSRRVVLALGVQDQVAALREAATPLRRDGLHSNPLLARVLARELALEEESGPGADARRTAALRVIARLFFERPVEENIDLADAAVLRQLLLRRWRLLALSADERLLVLTAMSGLGTMEDVPWILEWAGKKPVLSEELRLGFMASERILRRAIVLNTHAAVDLDDLRERVLEVATPVNRVTLGEGLSDSRFDWPRESVARLVCALGALRRSAGLMADVGQVLPVWEGVPGLQRNRWILYLRAIDRDPELIDLLESGQCIEQPHTRFYHVWGEFCGLFGEGVDLARVRASAAGMLEGADPGNAALCMGALEDAITAGQLLLQGHAPAFEPDENTRLGAFTGSSSWIELEAEASSAPAEPGRTIARWSVETHGMRTQGMSEPAVGQLVEHAKDVSNVGYLLLSQPGQSELRLPFQAGEARGDTSWSVLVSFMVASRAYVPHRGEATLELRIDGKALTSVHFFSRGYDVLEARLPLELIQPGEHVLSIALGEETNTTLRLFSVEIQRGE